MKSKRERRLGKIRALRVTVYFKNYEVLGGLDDVIFSGFISFRKQLNNAFHKATKTASPQIGSLETYFTASYERLSDPYEQNTFECEKGKQYLIFVLYFRSYF